MNVNLTPELESLVLKKVKSGRYNSASEVVREALRLLQDSEALREMQLRELHRKIDAGWASLQRGEVVDGEAFFKQLAAQEKKLPRKRKRT